MKPWQYIVSVAWVLGVSYLAIVAAWIPELVGAGAFIALFWYCHTWSDR